MCCTMRHDKCHRLEKIVYLVLWHVKAGWFCFLWVWNITWSVCPFWVLQESVTVSLISPEWLPEITCVALRHWSCPSNPLPCSARLYRVLSVLSFQRRCSGSGIWTIIHLSSQWPRGFLVMGWTWLGWAISSGVSLLMIFHRVFIMLFCPILYLRTEMKHCLHASLDRPVECLKIDCRCIWKWFCFWQCSSWSGMG